MEPLIRKVRPVRNKKVQSYGPKPELILKEICHIFEVPLETVLSKVRTKELATIRQLYYYVACTITDASQECISNVVGKERSSTLHHVLNVRAWLNNEDIYFMERWTHYIQHSVYWFDYNKK